MSKAQIKVLKLAVSILKKEFPPKYECKTYLWSCWSCRAYALQKEFASFVEDYGEFVEDKPKKGKKAV